MTLIDVMRKIFVILFLCLGCLEPYAPPPSTQDFHALVVDGFIDVDGSASVVLSRGIPLDAKAFAGIPSEQGATVTIESSNGEIFSLKEISTGTYTADHLTVDKNLTYTLHILTSDKSEYQSDKMKIYSTPPVDSVYWRISGTDQLQIMIDAHDDRKESTGFYGGYAVETYEYHAAISAHWKLVNHVVKERAPGEEVYVCYKDERTLNVVASTKNLTVNRVSGMILSTIDRTSPKISIRYSALARLRSISSEEYDFQRQLIISTEQTGSLFSQIPGTVVGNIHSLKDPSEYVLGYFRAQEVQELRYFIDENTHPLPLGFYTKTIPLCQPEAPCGTPGAPGGCVDPSALSDAAGVVGISLDANNNPIVAIFTTAECSDCTLKGGVTRKPSFW